MSPKKTTEEKAATAPCVMAIVSKAIFEKQARDATPGTVVPFDRYVSENKALEPLGSGGRLFMFTVRPEGEQLWLVAVLDELSHEGGAWVAARPNSVPIADISKLRSKIKFESGKGIAAKPGALAMSLQTPRLLAAEDVALVLCAAGGRPAPAPLQQTPAAAAPAQPAPAVDGASGDTPAVMAVVAKAVFEKQARGATPGTVVPFDRYVSENKALAPLGAGARLFMFTVRPEGEQLWLVAVLEKLARSGGAWVAAQPNRVPITDVSKLRSKIKFESGKGIAAKPGALAMSLQTPRLLAAADVALLLGAAGTGAAPAARARGKGDGAPAHADERAALLAAILAAPEEDAPRLVYADWLQERGDPRGELISVQCALAAGPEFPAQRHGLRQRERELLAAHGEAWAAPARELAKEWVFRRGFIDELSGKPGFLASAAALFALEPVQRLKLGGVGGRECSALASSRWLAQLRRLRLRGGFKDAGARAIAMSPYLTAITHLNFGDCGIRAAGAAALAAAPLRACRSLSLSGNRIGDDGVSSLLSSKLLASCRHLYLARCGLTDVGATLIAEAAQLAALTGLCLGSNAIGNDGALALVASQHLIGLRRLELNAMELSDATQKKLRERFGSALQLDQSYFEDAGDDGDYDE